MQHLQMYVKVIGSVFHVLGVPEVYVCGTAIPGLVMLGVGVMQRTTKNEGEDRHC